MMIKKEVKEYKQRDKTIQRINILQKDNIKGTVYIFDKKEYNNLQKELNRLKEFEVKQKENNKIIKEIEDTHHQTLKEIDQQHIDQLKQSYDQFNNDLQKYITVNQLQNTALKQIMDLGFIDMIRNKHKKIAKDQIKELKQDKKVYELTNKNI